MALEFNKSEDADKDQNVDALDDESEEEDGVDAPEDLILQASKV